MIDALPGQRLPWMLLTLSVLKVFDVHCRFEEFPFHSKAFQTIDQNPNDNIHITHLSDYGSPSNQISKAAPNQPSKPLRELDPTLPHTSNNKDLTHPRTRPHQSNHAKQTVNLALYKPP
jgi:hypothetical protein